MKAMLLQEKSTKRIRIGQKKAAKIAIPKE